MKSASPSKDALADRSDIVLPASFENSLTIFLFLLPALVFFLIFVIYPILQSVYYSLFNWKGFGPAVDFVGLDNYQRILTDQVFLKAVRNGLLIVVLSLTLQLPLALALALMVGRDLPGRAFFRIIFFMPYVFSEVITAIMWLGLLNPDPDRGFINALLVLIPGCQGPSLVGQHRRPVLACIFVVLTWKYFGFYMLLFMAGLQNIPAEIEEAALHRRREQTPDADPHHHAPARQHHPHVRLSVRLGFAAAIHPGLDHDEGRSGQCQRSHGDLYVSLRLCAFLAWVRLRRGDRHVPDLPGLFASFTSGWRANRITWAASRKNRSMAASYVSQNSTCKETCPGSCSTSSSSWFR